MSGTFLAENSTQQDAADPNSEADSDIDTEQYGVGNSSVLDFAALLAQTALKTKSTSIRTVVSHCLESRLGPVAQDQAMSSDKDSTTETTRRFRRSHA